MAFNEEITWVLDTDLSGGNPITEPTKTPPDGPLNNAIYQVFQNTEANKLGIEALNPGDFGGSVDHNSLGNILGGTTDQRYHLSEESYTDLVGTTQSSQDTLIGNITELANGFSSTLDTAEANLTEVTEALSGIETNSATNVTRVESNTTSLDSYTVGTTHGDPPPTPFWRGVALVYSKDLSNLIAPNKELLFNFSPASSNSSAIYVRGFVYLDDGTDNLKAACTKEWQIIDTTLMTISEAFTRSITNFSFKVVIDYDLGTVSLVEGSGLIDNIVGGVVEICGMSMETSPIIFTPKN